jgi:hypothetical protein
MKKHLLNEHQNDFVEYIIELESIKGGVGWGWGKNQEATKGATIDLSYNVFKLMGVIKIMNLYNINSSLQKGMKFCSS